MHSGPLVVCIQVSVWQISLPLTLLQGDMEAAKKKSHIICKGFTSNKTVGLPWWASLQNKRYDFSHKHSCQNFQSKGRNFEDARIQQTVKLTGACHAGANDQGQHKAGVKHKT